MNRFLKYGVIASILTGLNYSPSLFSNNESFLQGKETVLSIIRWLVQLAYEKIMLILNNL